jgi:meso-butanediol dehydrogenase / (S,S)-butanediol dehydrogenase / diacetyl reductase
MRFWHAAASLLFKMNILSWRRAAGISGATMGGRENRRSGHFRGIAPWRARVSLHRFAEFRRFGSAQQAVGNDAKAMFWRRCGVSFGSCFVPQAPPGAKAFDVRISLSEQHIRWPRRPKARRGSKGGQSMSRLHGKVAIVTGGAQGIGEGIASRLVQEGAKVAIADMNGDKAKSVADSLNRSGANAIAISVDVANRAQVQAAIQETVKSFGRLDIFFNNAGFNRPLPFMEVDENNFNAIMRVNAWGVLACTQEAAKQMMVQGEGGKIINTASIAGRQGYAEFAPYCASKASVISLTQAAAREFAKHKITVNAFAPGVVVTPLWDGLEQDMIDKGVIKQRGEFIESFSSSILLGFPSKPKDIAGIAAFLASADSDYITGQVIMADGGMVLV